MADEIDLTSDRIEFDVSVSAKLISEKAKEFDKGQPGECFLCGEEFSRVILVEKDGQQILACGGCRDRYGIK